MDGLSVGLHDICMWIVEWVCRADLIYIKAVMLP